MTVASRVFGGLIYALNAAGSLLILAAMILMCLDVFMRDLANRPIDGVAELVAASIIVIVFLQLPSTIRTGRMVQADLFIDSFVQRHPVAGHLVRAAFDMLGVAMMTVIFQATMPLFLRAWTENDFFGVQDMFTAPTWPIRLVVLVGTLFAALQYLILGTGNVLFAARAWQGSHVRT